MALDACYGELYYHLSDLSQVRIGARYDTIPQNLKPGS
jgi:hypothetical protein